MVKYAFGFPMVAMVSHIPVKSRITGNDVTEQKPKITRRDTHSGGIPSTGMLPQSLSS